MFLHRNTHEAIKEKRCHFCGWERPLRLKLWRLDYCPDNHNPTCTISNYGFCFNELMHLTTVPSFTTARLWVQILYHETEEELFVNVSLFRKLFFHSNYSMTHSFFLSRLLTFYNFFKKNGPNLASFCLFSFFHTTRIAQISVSKRRWCAWDSNPGQQDCRHSRIHWAMAAPLLFSTFAQPFAWITKVPKGMMPGFLFHHTKHSSEAFHLKESTFYISSSA